MERLLLEVESFELTSDSEITAPTWFIRAAGAGRVEIKRRIIDGSTRIVGVQITQDCGQLTANVGDWIVRLPNGYIVPFNKALYERTLNAFHRYTWNEVQD